MYSDGTATLEATDVAAEHVGASVDSLSKHVFVDLH